MIVVDASATLAWLFVEYDPIDWLSEQLSEQALVAPALWRLEVVNSILKKERQGRITQEQADKFLGTLDAFAVEIAALPETRTLEQLAKFARPFQLSAYDAVYLELALAINAPLLSLDNNLKMAAARAGVGVVTGPMP